MSKMTFIEFLTEFDRSDLELGRSKMRSDANAAARTQGRDEFRMNQANASPSVGDMIKLQSGSAAVAKMDREGIHLRNGEVLPHGTKFKNLGKGQGGKMIFAVA